MRRRYAVALAIAAVVVALDLLTKRWAAGRFTTAPEAVIDGVLALRFVENPGGAFSILPRAGWLLGVAAVIALVFVLALLRTERPRWEVVGFGLVIGGALGNLFDRVLRGPGLLDGPVIDWIDFLFIPTFNVADMSVTFAVVVLLVGAWFTTPQREPG